MEETTLRAGSHIPVINTLMLHVDKPVLELGIGWNSTPIFHWLCQEKKLPLLSFESDQEWLERFKCFESETHHLFFHDFMSDIEVDFDIGLVFIDHRPARKRRHNAKYFKDKADFVVLHDSELANNPAYKYTPVYDEFKYKHEYKIVGEPHTMILSNRINLEEVFNENNR